jgi:2,5-furandicarboxylate decarboxylase 1
MQMESPTKQGTPSDLRAWLAYLAERGKLAVAR